MCVVPQVESVLIGAVKTQPGLLLVVLFLGRDEGAVLRRRALLRTWATSARVARLFLNWRRFDASDDGRCSRGEFRAAVGTLVVFPNGETFHWVGNHAST